MIGIRNVNRVSSADDLRLMGYSPRERSQKQLTDVKGGHLWHVRTSVTERELMRVSMR